MKYINVKLDPEARETKAMALFREGYNCCQSVALAFDDVLSEVAGLSPKQISDLCSGFGGGFARLREVCGCVSGMTFVAGAVCPATAARNGDHNDMESKRDNYALVQTLASRFRQENGSIVCRELIGLRSAGALAAPCERLAGIAARILAEEL